MLESIYSDAEFAVESLEQQPDGSYGASYTVESEDENLRGFVYVEQHNQQLYHLIFQAERRDWFGLAETYNDIVASYVVNPPAPVTPPTPTPAPLPPTPPPTPTPATSGSNIAPQAGRSRIYMINEYPEELTFTINDQEHRIGLNTEFPVDLEAGRYTYTISIPFGAVNGEVDMGPNQSWAILVDVNGNVFGPQQIYP